MEIALYCPVYGYYEKEEDTIGRGGDYYTSVSVGPLFGELLAWQFARWLGADPQADGPASLSASHPEETVEVVEVGAHRGDLARDILEWIRRRQPGLFRRLQYRIIEPSGRRRRWQQETLAGFAPKVLWSASLGDIADHPPASGPACRIIFANELLDALPVHRLGWDAEQRVWFEWGVTLEDGGFRWMRLPGPAPCLAAGATLPFSDERFSALLPDGFVVELCPAAVEWWRLAADVLGRGRLLTFDYGLTADELLVPERKNGTLRGYRRHEMTGDVLASPGEQDITAHVNFTAIQAAGEAAGLQTEGFLTQAQFLTRIAGAIWQGDGCFGDWTARHTRQFQTLTHPDHLGRSFRVLVQERS